MNNKAAKEAVKRLIERFAVDGSIRMRGMFIEVNITYHCPLCENSKRLNRLYQNLIQEKISEISRKLSVNIRCRVFGYDPVIYEHYLPNLGK